MVVAVSPSLQLQRRHLLGAGGLGLVLPSSLARAAPFAPLPPGDGQRVLITGSNSGIGRDAAGKLAAAGWRVTLACRTLEKAERAAAELTASAERPLEYAFTPVECDLTSLASVRRCALSVGGAPLQRLCLNAGLQYSGSAEVHRTEDGFEETVGVNHLGHFLLSALLQEQVEKAGGRVVVTASEVHDPQSEGGKVGAPASLGDLAGLRAGPRFDMIDGLAYDAQKAYADSKLCNVLFARELARRFAEKSSGASAVSYGPGLITRTGFFRNQPPLFTSLFDFATNDVFRVAESVSGGGDILAFMVAAPSSVVENGSYWNNDLAGFGGHDFHIKEPSVEARDGEKGRALWEASARLVGLNA